jgi:hypothetical protein
MHYFLIPKESVIYKKLYFRNDTNRFRLVFGTNDKNFIETYSNENFGKFLKEDINYEDFLIFAN